MKILVYGAGVIGGQLAHALHKCGNDVTLRARGAWAETLQREGLRIHHCIQRTDTVDSLRVITADDGQYYDAVFAVMQYRQMEKILNDLAALNSPLIVLTGNNLSPQEMASRIHAVSSSPKTVLFAFGSTAGIRADGKLTTVHAGDGSLTIGGADTEVPADIRQKLEDAFGGGRLSVSWCDNMDSWLKYHAAFILPVVYLCYKTQCDLTRASGSDRKLLLQAVKDAYGLLMELGYPVRPVGDEKSLEPGILNMAVKAVVYLVCRTRIGALCTSEHCKHAPQEMFDLHQAFMELRKKRPAYPMPSFDRLYAQMPSWQVIMHEYPR